MVGIKEIPNSAYLVGILGLEPRPLWHVFLRHACLPFHHIPIELVYFH